ncbi:MAG: hypothetical protein ETSY1_01905 [Candidatus Entotheonella factor]|uniref:Uncharacterized protein n=1 Tax=Entotheonella factor TaxID=1429438 RepID=W4LZV2_ENTF1|nr:MAG: hypothetical protein ETSY1_01905 [Candidatus Entotheonella factor]
MDNPFPTEWGFKKVPKLSCEHCIPERLNPRLSKNGVFGQPKSRPKGSGWFSIIFGFAFLAVLVYSIYFGLDLTKINPHRVFQGWLFLAGILLIGWGANRISTSVSPVVGQDTINFVMTIIAVTIALLTIVVSVTKTS